MQKDGFEKILGVGKVTAFEQKLIDASVPELQKSIKKGEEFVENLYKK